MSHCGACVWSAYTVYIIRVVKSIAQGELVGLVRGSADTPSTRQQWSSALSGGRARWPYVSPPTCP